MKDIEFDKEVEKLYQSLDKTYANRPEKEFIKADIAQKLSGQVKYLEQVSIKRTSKTEYTGSIMMGKIFGSEDVPIQFKYSLKVPFKELNEYTDKLENLSLTEQRNALEDLIKISISRDSVEVKDEGLKNGLINYLQGSVPYALGYLEEQIDSNGKEEGIFKIPRSL